MTLSAHPIAGGVAVNWYYAEAQLSVLTFDATNSNFQFPVVLLSVATAAML